METVRLARHSMGSRFELVLHGEDIVWLRAAGEQALDEIERLDAQLSIYRSDSEVSLINARAAAGPVLVEPRLFQLLLECERLYRETDGAFDVTVAPLMRAWGFFRDSGRLPDAETLEEARRRTGMHHVELDPESRTIRFRREGVMLDFGGIGKGFAIDEALQLLREAGVSSAFLHGGTSTMAAIGRPPDASAWNVAVTHRDTDARPVAIVPLVDASLSVSAVWGKAFEADGTTFGHVLDPVTGRPVQGAVLTAVRADTTTGNGTGLRMTGVGATEGDARSTALLVRGTKGLDARFPSLLAFESDGHGVLEVIEAGLKALPSASVIVRN